MRFAFYYVCSTGRAMTKRLYWLAKHLLLGATQQYRASLLSLTPLATSATWTGRFQPLKLGASHLENSRESIATEYIVNRVYNGIYLRWWFHHTDTIEKSRHIKARVRVLS